MCLLREERERSEVTGSGRQRDPPEIHDTVSTAASSTDHSLQPKHLNLSIISSLAGLDTHITHNTYITLLETIGFLEGSIMCQMRVSRRVYNVSDEGF